MSFRRGVKEAKEAAKRVPFEAGLLPLDEKERLCRSLLAEFGVTQVVPGAGHELIHSCCLPIGRHSNGDRNPSASMNFEKLTYNCRGCGNSGGLLWFIATCRESSSNEASQWLARQTGTDGTVQDLAALLEFFDALYDRRGIDSSPIPKLDRSVLDPWLSIHPYMTEIRHIPAETLMQHLVGYGEFRINIGDLDRPRWITSERIVIPHIWEGNLVGWQTRRLIKDGTPRWKSSADFPKDTTIYGYNRFADEPFIVESPMNRLRHVHHIPDIEGTFGASVTPRQIRLLSRHKRMVLWFDNDEAGWNATENVGSACEAYSKVYVVDNPYAADPADMPDEVAEEQARSPIPFSLWSRPDPEKLIPKTELVEAA